MNARDVVKRLMDEHGVTNATMADKLKITQAALWDRLNNRKNKSITVSKLNPLLRELGFKLVIVPRDKAIRLDGCYILDDDE